MRLNETKTNAFKQIYRSALSAHHQLLDSRRTIFIESRPSSYSIRRKGGNENKHANTPTRQHPAAKSDRNRTFHSSNSMHDPRRDQIRSASTRQLHFLGENCRIFHIHELHDIVSRRKGYPKHEENERNIRHPPIALHNSRSPIPPQSPSQGAKTLKWRKIKDQKAHILCSKSFVLSPTIQSTSMSSSPSTPQRGCFQGTLPVSEQLRSKSEQSNEHTAGSDAPLARYPRRSPWRRPWAWTGSGEQR